MKNKIFFVSFILSLSLLTFSCNTHNSNPTPAKPQILVSLAPYQHLVKKIVGDSYCIQTVVPIGADPHTYEPNAKQATQIANASIWFRIGEPFEKKLLTAIKQKNPSLEDIDLREQIPLLHNHSCCHHHHDDSDRHFWLSPKITILQIPIMTKALIQKFPQHQEIFQNNAKNLIQEFQDLDAELTALLAPVQHRSFLVSHPAFAYFCHDYSFHQLSIEYEGKEPTPRHLQETIENASSENVKLALAQPQHPTKGLLLVADKLHLPVHTIDPYSPNALETMRLLAQWIKDSEPQ